MSFGMLIEVNYQKELLKSLLF